MGPRVDANLMAGHVFLDQHRGTLNDAGANNKESRLDILLIKIIEKGPVFNEDVQLQRAYSDKKH